MEEDLHILFDLDGTITDSCTGIINSIIYSLKYFGIDEKNMEKLKKFIGPPLLESFSKYYGFNKEKSQKALYKYREYYADKGIFENFLYDGIEDLLRRLKEKGIHIVLATSKPEVYAKKILKYFNIDKYFDFVSGADFEETRVNKDEIIYYALKELNITNKSKVIMIGDRQYDILGAKKNGIKSIGVLYGFGTLEELKTNGADFIAKNVSDIFKIISNV
ncbi:HAD family hydrolase [Clostridium sp. BJN0001]|uniref:HAD family hydrolase n=1 Tax=Clostridium sp. BJN0001 TaxID=2930219 RepID=UPI001FD41481|nr:HAD family hydrolase [Clostridium sp. BJN0001]